MTLEEFLTYMINSHTAISRCTIACSKAFRNEAVTEDYLEGIKDGLKFVLEELPNLEHDLTVQEVKDYCKNHEGELGCDERCSLYGYFCLGRTGEAPRNWNLIKLEKRVKEEK